MKRKAAGWPGIEQTLRQVLEAEAEPSLPESVEINKLKTMVRRAVAGELEPMKEALARSGTAAAPTSGPTASSSLSLRKRLHQRWAWRAWNRIGNSVPHWPPGAALGQRGIKHLTGNNRPHGLACGTDVMLLGQALRRLSPLVSPEWRPIQVALLAVAEPASVLVLERRLWELQLEPASAPRPATRSGAASRARSPRQRPAQG
jgi:hypothetical protein